MDFVASQHHPHLWKVRIGGGWHVLRNDPEPSEKTESAPGTALAARGSSEGDEGSGNICFVNGIQMAEMW